MIKRIKGKKGSGLSGEALVGLLIILLVVVGVVILIAYVAKSDLWGIFPNFKKGTDQITPDTLIGELWKTPDNTGTERLFIYSNTGKEAFAYLVTDKKTPLYAVIQVMGQKHELLGFAKAESINEYYTITLFPTSAEITLAKYYPQKAQEYFDNFNNAIIAGKLESGTKIYKAEK